MRILSRESNNCSQPHIGGRTQRAASVPWRSTRCAHRHRAQAAQERAWCRQKARAGFTAPDESELLSDDDSAFFFFLDFDLDFLFFFLDTRLFFFFDFDFDFFLRFDLLSSSANRASVPYAVLGGARAKTV